CRQNRPTPEWRPERSSSPHCLCDRQCGRAEARAVPRGPALDADGVVTGGRTQWTEVPNWFSWENQGGGIAVVDRGATRDLVVFAVDNPPGANRYASMIIGGGPEDE